MPVCRCQLHWSRLLGQLLELAGDFWTMHRHSGASFLGDAQFENRTVQASPGNLAIGLLKAL